MELDAEALPDDPATLRAMLLAERTLRIEAERRAEQLEGFLAALRRNRFGARSERLDPDQLNLGLEEIEQEIGAASAAAERLAGSPARRQPRARNLGHLPDHLPRIERIVDIADKRCPCCCGDLHPIGEDLAERLDVVPAQFRVLVTRRPKYACRSCEGTVVQAPAPGHVVESGLPTEALVAQVVAASTPTTCRSIARRGSTRARASNSTGQRWPIGSAARPGSWSRSTPAYGPI